MPLEIKELHIKATVFNESENQSNTGGSTSGGGDSNEDVISVCVEKVIEILKDKMER